MLNFPFESIERSVTSNFGHCMPFEDMSSGSSEPETVTLAMSFSSLPTVSELEAESEEFLFGQSNTIRVHSNQRYAGGTVQRDVDDDVHRLLKIRYDQPYADV